MSGGVFKFNLSSLSGTKKVISAKLSLYKTKLNVYDSRIGGYYHAAKVLKKWDIKGYTWQLKAGGSKTLFEDGVFSTNAYDTTDTRVDTLDWIHFNVTQYVKDNQGSSSNNNGIGISVFPYPEFDFVEDETKYMVSYFATANHKNVNIRPRLTIITESDKVSSKEIEYDIQGPNSLSVSQGVLKVKLDGNKDVIGKITIDIFSVNGRLVGHFIRNNIDGNSLEINLKKEITLPDGSYLFRVHNDQLNIIEMISFFQD